MKKRLEWDAVIVLVVIVGGLVLVGLGKDGNVLALIGTAVGYYFGKSLPATTD